MTRFVVLILVYLWMLNPYASGASRGGFSWKEAKPFVGAQVFIEPGQQSEEVEHWFRTLRDCHMEVCRIRMFEAYMKDAAGDWDFSLFDRAFDLAHRYGVRVYATLFPFTRKDDIGGWKFPADEVQKAAFARYIQALVSHYRNHPALAGWVILNEPGLDGKYPQTKFFADERKRWDEVHPLKDSNETGSPVLMTTRQWQFVNDLTSSFLHWIAQEIRKYDSMHDIHVNPANVFGNYGEYDFPRWRSFLTSLGGSAHPSWHFGYFRRQDYALAMLAQAEMLRSGAGHLPWFMTEIQGGNNVYSGIHPMCPTPAEILQWLWLIYGCEGKGGIFWMLNPRMSGIEAGEWALLDFQGRPSDRLKAARSVAEAVRHSEDDLRNARVIPSGIDILYTRESLWAETVLARRGDALVGRTPGAAIKSALACFRALTERGLNVGLKEVNEYDFSQANYTGRTIVLSHQVSLSSQHRTALEHFVSQGGTLLVEGLTAFLDEHLRLTWGDNNPWEALLGEKLSEFVAKTDTFPISVMGHSLPAHLWEGRMENEDNLWHVHSYGKGMVVWVPSNIALGAWTADNYRPLSDFLIHVLPQRQDAVRFTKYCRGVLLRTLQTGNGYMWICVSKSPRAETIELKQTVGTLPVVVYASPGCRWSNGRLVMQPEGVLVLSWRNGGKRLLPGFPVPPTS